jgi:dUTPase
MHATAGSTALDLAIDKHLTVPPKIQWHKIITIMTGVYGSLSFGTVGMVLGRSGLTYFLSFFLFLKIYLLLYVSTL